MHLLNILWRQKDKVLIILLAFVISVLIISPIIKGGLKGAFYSIDPDVPYVANALLYIKYGIIAYFDHPGTVAINIDALLLMPFRFYAKYVIHTQFITWAFNNYSLIFYYLRLSQGLIIFISLLILGLGIRVFSKNNLVIIILYLLLLLNTAFYEAGSFISAEATSYLLVSIWILILSYYFKTSRKILFIPLGLIEGLAFANRATNLFTIIAGLLIVIVEKTKPRNKLLIILVSLIFIYLGFSIGIKATGKDPAFIFKIVFNFASYSGTQLGGQRIFYDPSTYIGSILSLLNMVKPPGIVFLISVIISFIFLFTKNLFNRKMSLIILIMSLGVLAYAKFPVPRYQNANYLVITFFLTVLISRLSSKILIPIIILCLYFAIHVSSNYLNGTTYFINQAKIFENFIEYHPAQHASIFEWSRNEEFAYLWSRDFAIDMFNEQLINKYPKIYQYLGNEMKIETDKYSHKNLSEVCWDQIYVRKQTLPSLLKSYPSLENYKNEITGTDMIIINYDYCDIRKI